MKTKIFFDFDNTLVNSTKAFIDVYNLLYQDNIDSTSIHNYDFSPQIKLEKNQIVQIFSSTIFYDKLKIFDGVEKFLKKLHDSNLFEVIMVTNCSCNSISKKIEYLKNSNLDQYINSKIYLDVNKCADKSLINMHNAIFIDDHLDNHKTSNAEIKCAYISNKNQNWSPQASDPIYSFTDWSDPSLYDMFINFNNYIQKNITCQM